MWSWFRIRIWIFLYSYEAWLSFQPKLCVHVTRGPEDTLKVRPISSQLLGVQAHTDVSPTSLMERCICINMTIIFLLAQYDCNHAVSKRTSIFLRHATSLWHLFGSNISGNAHIWAFFPLDLKESDGHWHPTKTWEVRQLWQLHISRSVPAAAPSSPHLFCFSVNCWQVKSRTGACFIHQLPQHFPQKHSTHHTYRHPQ